MVMQNEIRALRAVAHLRAFAKFIGRIQYHQHKVGYLMELCGDHKTGTVTTLLDVANRTRNAHKVDKGQAVLVSTGGGGL